GVQHRFHFFGIDLEAADVDDTADSAPEVIASVLELHHVAGVHVTVIAHEKSGDGSEIAGGVASRANSQRVVHDLELDVAGGLVDERRGKSCQPIVHVEGNAR